MVNTGRLFIIGVSILIGFLAYTSQIFIFWDFLGGLNVHCLTVLIPFNISVILIYWNYFLTCTTDPGRVPKDWYPKENQEDVEIKRTTHSPRYCRTCSAYKPPRSHHCRTCKRCVLKMDHHCPWTNNCVGYFNYGHFIRFVFWVDVACIYHFTLMIKRTMRLIEDISYIRYDIEPSTLEIVFLILNYAAVIPVLFSVGMLSMYHFYCMWTNTTTIENWEKDKVATMVRRGKIKEVIFPYDIGFIENIRANLGDNPILWCWPQEIKGTGLSFPISKDADPSIIWPPKDPDAITTSSMAPKPWDIYNNHFNSNSRNQKYSRQFVRRDSEGYLVRDLSLEERAMLSSNSDREGVDEHIDDPYHNSDGSTLYSESDEYSYNEDEKIIDETAHDDFDDDNYPEHIGIGDDRNDYNHSNRRLTKKDQKQSRNIMHSKKNDEDDNVPIGILIGKKQLEAMGYDQENIESHLKITREEDFRNYTEFN
ncbi:zf-DHHC-domain-containing protein [Gigaspora margarita]|uniref:Palmitoyltransferase PFA4 n=1 Tax=Gigaspora margarita TaxID=4874 RepID=A0A8H4A8T0_GIGMA|nr:zf-DHHC-domain-containing protein [Gigaspora margarita]